MQRLRIPTRRSMRRGPGTSELEAASHDNAPLVPRCMRYARQSNEACITRITMLVYYARNFSSRKRESNRHDAHDAHEPSACSQLRDGGGFDCLHKYRNQQNQWSCRACLHLFSDGDRKHKPGSQFSANSAGICAICFCLARE